MESMTEISHHVGAFSPEMALLGLLYAGPSHGYDLHKKVSSDLGHVWHLSQSQAYSILKRLEKQGDISVEEVEQERTRQRLRATPAGVSKFLRWVDEPSSGSIRAIRLEFITKVYFAKNYFPEKLSALFDTQRKGAEFHITRLEQMLIEQPELSIYDRMSLTLRKKHLMDVIEWLDAFRPTFIGA